MEDRAVLSPEPPRTRRDHATLPRRQRALRQAAYGGVAMASALARALPRRALLAVAGATGGLAFSVAARHRRRVLEHLGIAFPQEDVRKRRRLAKRVFVRLAQNAGEVMKLPGYDAARLLDLVRFEGLEGLEAAVAAGRGVLLVTGHVGCWELMAAALCLRGVPLNVIAREVYDPRLDRMLVGTRAAHGVKTIAREGASSGRDILRTLKKGEVLGLLIDVDIKGPGAFVPFFGRPAWTPTGAAAFSLRTKAPVVMGFINREGDRHVCRLEPPLAPLVTGDKEADLLANTARYTASIEAAIRRQPEDWVWTHRRWRRVP